MVAGAVVQRNHLQFRDDSTVYPLQFHAGVETDDKMVLAETLLVSIIPPILTKANNVAKANRTELLLEQVCLMREFVTLCLETKEVDHEPQAKADSMHRKVVVPLQKLVHELRWGLGEQVQSAAHYAQEMLQ